MIADGVTQYRLDWQPSTPVANDQWAMLNRWRTVMHDKGVIGQCPDRYDGVGFGNVSCRWHGSEFLISGTQTGALRELKPAQYAHVLECDVHRNYVRACGPVPPSSEAMTHAMIYDCVPTAQFVIHVHAPALWRAATSLSIPMTPQDVGYGTPAMADAVAALMASGPVEMIAMGGHEDGIIAWSANIACLGTSLCAVLDKAAASA